MGLNPKFDAHRATHRKKNWFLFDASLPIPLLVPMLYTLIRFWASKKIIKEPFSCQSFFFVFYSFHQKFTSNESWACKERNGIISSLNTLLFWKKSIFVHRWPIWPFFWPNWPNQLGLCPLKDIHSFMFEHNGLSSLSVAASHRHLSSPLLRQG